MAEMSARETGVIAAHAGGAAFGAKHSSTTTPNSPTRSSGNGTGHAGGRRLVVNEPVGVVGAIVAWNAPMGLISTSPPRR